jgi:hypothetical protein
MWRSFLAHRALAAVARAGCCVLLVAACSSPSTGTAKTPAASATPSATSSAPTFTAARLPNSCSSLTTLVGPYVGGTASARSLAKKAVGVSCEFANSSASSIVVVNIGQGSAAQFAILKAGSGNGGRTVTPISGLGSAAFSISNKGLVRGTAVLTSQGAIYSVSSTLTLAQDEALISQMMQL